nr:unnamed protein product [Digitaria exilis]
MDTKRRRGEVATDTEEARRKLWSVCRNVTKTPMSRSAAAKGSMALMWPCAGNGNTSTEVLDSPPSPSASFACRIAARARSRSSRPPSDSISHLTLAATSSSLTISWPSYPSSTTASRSSSTRNTLFSRCSAYIGHASIGTPPMTASSTEFQPQCVTNPPTAPCASTSLCGAHDMTTSPLPSVRATKPSGRMASRSASSSPGGRRTTHRNRCPLVSSPRATCLVCSAVNRPMVPKQRNTTLDSGWPSSHARHSWRRPGAPPASSNFTSGPTQCSGGVRRPGGVQRPLTMASVARGSSERKLFTIMPCELHICSDKARKCR